MVTALPEIGNWIGGTHGRPTALGRATKFAPSDGSEQSRIVRSGPTEVGAAVTAARAASDAWADMAAPARGRILLDIAQALRGRAREMAETVAAETGKSIKEALGETGGAVQLGEFFAGEGMRLHGRTLPSGSPDKLVQTIRQPHGVAALIIAANTPIANIAWKVFPALICGNTAVLKAAEDTPATADLFARIAHEAGLPAGVLNVVQGLGAETGQALVDHPGIDVISFTGSTAVGRRIGESAGRRLQRVSLELGGKNPLVVCDDADLDNAVKWALLSAFSNAGQRCAAASRIIVLDAVHDEFRRLLLERTAALRVGPGDDDDLGPVINLRQLDRMEAAVAAAEARGARIAIGGRRLDRPGFYMAPTVLEGLPIADELTNCELFGPVAVLNRVPDYAEALAAANASEYGLTAAIHTRSVDRAHHFSRKVRAGLVNVNLGTFGSEPHFPFGGVGASGNGTREPGLEALDVYSDLKVMTVTIDRSRL